MKIIDLDNQVGRILTDEETAKLKTKIDAGEIIDEFGEVLVWDEIIDCMGHIVIEEEPYLECLRAIQ